MIFRNFLLSLLLTGACLAVDAQQDRKPVLLNMNTYNAETNGSRYQSTVNLLLLAGVPFDTTSVLDTALQYPVIITGSRIVSNAFTPAQRLQLQDYVSNGGILISSSLRDTLFFPLFGITASVSDDLLHRITFNTDIYPQYFAQVDDSLEQTIPLGDTTDPAFFTRAYTLSTAQSLAKYEDGRCALAMNPYGMGKTYLLGPDLRDLVLRNQLNLDTDAQRTYSNGFEPATDVVAFIVRNIIRQHIPHTVYKYTSPGNSSSVLLVTHDIDSQTGIDTMGYFSAFEYAAGIPAHYNITTRYVHDSWMTGFYLGSWPQVHALLGHGHTIASHSVGHFPDFDLETVFPYGTLGNTPAVYQPEYFAGATTGGTVLGEVEVSKNLLENDHGVPVRSFRAGHLCYPDSLGMALEITGYEFNSTRSANNVLTGFPYRMYNDISFSGTPAPVLEIPMTISDVFAGNPISDTNYLEKVAVWAQVCRQYDRNNAPVTLLIHPNRLYKLNALQNLLDSIPATMQPYAFESYGEFWRKRDSLLFHTSLVNDTLYVYMDNDKLDTRQSFVIDHTGLDTVLFFDVNGNPVSFTAQAFSAEQTLWYRSSEPAAVRPVTIRAPAFGLYPNPTAGSVTITAERLALPAVMAITDLAGHTVYTDQLWSTRKQIDFAALGFQPGIFLVWVTGNGYTHTQKLIYLKE